MGPYEPTAERRFHPIGASSRPAIGRDMDWLVELGRQIYRPLIGLICALALADQMLFAAWFRHGEGRFDAATLAILAGLIAALCGLRGWELRNGAPA